MWFNVMKSENEMKETDATFLSPHSVRNQDFGGAIGHDIAKERKEKGKGRKGRKVRGFLWVMMGDSMFSFR